jgi:disulfide bond formation protein DsbB
MIELQKNLNALLVLILAGVLLSAFGVQFIYHEQPCPLCLLQRVGMIGVACAAVLNLWFGLRMSHYGLMLVFCVFGGFVALRQISLHVCPGFSTFGLPVLGLSLYTWSFIAFVCVVAYVAMLLFLYDPAERDKDAPLTRLHKFSLVLILGIALGNVITTFLQCGWGPCAD